MWPIKQIRNRLALLKLKASPVYRSMLTGLSGSPIWNTEDLERLAKEGYQNCFAVFACVKQIVDAAGAIPWDLFRKPTGPTGKKEKVENHALNTLMKRPNPQDGGAAFIKNTLAFYLISGNSYLMPAGPVVGPPKELYYSRPERIKILPGNNMEPIRGYRYTVNGRPKVPDFLPEEVLHLKAFHPTDDWYGLSPIRVAARQIDIQARAAKWNYKLLNNDMRPPGALVAEKNLDQEQHDRLEKKIEEKFAGYDNAGKPFDFEGGLKWQSFAITPHDMDWLESDKLNTRKICAILNVAPELIGDGENKTFSNYKEARKALYLENILPLMDYYRDELNNWLTPMWGDDRLYLEYNKDAIDALREELNAIVEREAKAWWRTLNQHREATGDGGIGPEGDVILIPANLIPFSDISGNRDEE